MVITSLERPRSRRTATRLDLALIVTSVVVALTGIVMVYTATRSSLEAAGIEPTYFLKRQAVFVVIGLAGMIGAALLDYRRLETVAMLIYGIMVFLLIVVLSPIGSHALGSQRWFAIGPFQLQPSEFGVLAMILAVATFCSRRSEGMSWGDVLRVLVLAGIPMVLVIKQPDLGTAMIMLVVLMVMLAVAGLPLRIFLLLLIGLVLVVLVVLKAGLLHQYQITRLTTFLHQDNSTNQAAIYNLNEAKDAIGSGGIWGTGIGHGAQTNLGYVPEQQTDFIFTAVGEQLGFVGATLVLGLLAVASWRILRTAQLARDSFGRLLCAGLFAFLAFSVFQNAGMTMGIMPVAGIPLPFMSYGGSAVLCFFIAVGLSLSVYARRSG